MKINIAKADNIWLTRVVATLHSSAADKNIKLVVTHHAMMLDARYTLLDSKFVVKLYSVGGRYIRTLVMVVNCGTTNRKYCEDYSSYNYSNIQPQWNWILTIIETLRCIVSMDGILHSHDVRPHCATQSTPCMHSCNAPPHTDGILQIQVEKLSHNVKQQFKMEMPTERLHSYNGSSLVQPQWLGQTKGS